MLLGCCHCGEEPPSDSGVSSSSVDVIETIKTGCSPSLQRCLDQTVPLRFSISVAKVGSPAAVCHPHYEGSFTLFYVPGQCYWYESAERAKTQSGASCNDTPSVPRWRLIIGSGGLSTGFGLQGITGAGAVVNYSVSVSPGNVNCVGSFTLNRTFQEFNWSFSSTVTITPI